MLPNGPLGEMSALFNTVPEVVALGPDVMYGEDCVVEGGMGVATTSFEARFCERRGRIEEGGGPESRWVRTRG
jgi:hypothetical protein